MFFRATDYLSLNKQPGFGAIIMSVIPHKFVSHERYISFLLKPNNSVTLFWGGFIKLYKCITTRYLLNAITNNKRVASWWHLTNKTQVTFLSSQTHLTNYKHIISGIWMEKAFCIIFPPVLLQKEYTYSWENDELKYNKKILWYGR